MKPTKQELLISWLNKNPHWEVSYLLFSTNFRISNEEYVDPNGKKISRKFWGSYETACKVKIAPRTHFDLFVDGFSIKHLPFFSTTRLLEFKKQLKSEIKTFDSGEVPERFSHRNNLRQRNNNSNFLILIDNVLLSRKDAKSQLGALLD